MDCTITILAFSVSITIGISSLCSISSMRKHAHHTFDQTMNQLATSESVSLWDPQNWQKLALIEDAERIESISNWIGSQALTYDHRASEHQKKGGVCGCRPWLIEFGQPRQSIAIHSHHVIVNNAIAFRPRDFLDLDDFARNVREYER